ncbi:DUF1802 family protein [Phycisphaerales bacterium AB-hyl4]|uniref:DUF1802 family protein n=1 Tax=Natronomicrosphaera hydrolytica TaxID=3242702 RepID=A0ABV4U4X8_9BACT
MRDGIIMLDVALKEWAVVCDLLLEGELALLLRKGGIHERGGVAVFELEHPRFALFPAWLHQVPNRMKPAYRDRVVRRREEPGEVTLKGVGEATHIWQVPSREAFDSLDDLHVWSKPQIDMRFNYKPERPLYLVAVRVSRLVEPKVVANRPTYAGCKSWVPLAAEDAVDDAGAAAVVDDARYEAMVARVERAMRG